MLGRGLKKTLTKTEAHSGMAQRPVRDLAIEEALQIETQSTLAHKNQSYVKWYALSDAEISKNKLKLTVTYDMG